MKDLKGTKTEQCLQDAFAGESMAHMKYLYYSSQAKKDGYVQISIFLRRLRLMRKNMRNYGSNGFILTTRSRTR